MSHPEQVISTPVGNEDLTEELARAKRGVGKPTIGLGLAVLVAVAFVAGMWTHSAFAGSGRAGQAGGRAGYAGGARAGGQGEGGTGQGGTGQGGFGRGGTVGTVDHVDGNTVYVKTQDGTVVKVSTSDSTQVQKTSRATLGDLAPGASVTVQGQRADDGSVTAQAITVRP